MKKVLFTVCLCLCAGLSAWAQQVVNVKSISQLRALEKGTSVVLEMARDTVMPTREGDFCLCGDMRIRVNAQTLKPMTVVSGNLAGMVGECPDGSPLLIELVEEGYSYVVKEELPWTQVVDIVAYERNLAQQQPYVDPWSKVPEDQRPGIGDVATIKELKRMEPGVEARLRLCNDTVLYVNGVEAYVRDGDRGGAIKFVDMNLSLQQGMVLLGTVVGRLVEQDGHLVFTATENTTDQYFVVTEIRDYTMLNYDWDSGESSEHVDDVVGTGEVVVDSLADAAGVRRLYAYVDGHDGRLQLTDRYGFSRQPIRVPARCANLKGILNAHGGQLELFPLEDISAVAHPAGIASLLNADATSSGQRYDLGGRRLSSKQPKGVYIDRGRKRVMK